MINKFLSLLIAFSLLMQTGCSLFAPSTQAITITTTEPGATIFVNGAPVGQGVASTVVRRNEEVAVMAKKNGFIPATKTIPTTISSSGIADIIGGAIFLVPFFGVLSPGFHKLESSQVTLYLQRKE